MSQRPYFCKGCNLPAAGCTCETIQSSARELLPCPFCGATTAVVIHDEHQQAWMLCRSCLAEGPIRETDDNAMSAWNRRVQPAAVRELVEAANRAVEAMVKFGEKAGYDGGWPFTDEINDLTAALAALPEGGK